jgi:hypothetical protein
LWGVSAHPEKAAALAAEGAQVFPEINQAIIQATLPLRQAGKSVKTSCGV